ncbi:C1 family peptidase [Leptospira ilyithenensis]|uniref:Cysteine protease n=1 Tax=Leptospira ilyithenensis TaxID=2484901 RepID=A0A4R9LUD9_9LEPT|nr:C1 family peptidase [Leptospira ilyithenensis]TGN14505.1 cysteine protease [Leptospira ilyithenensis]
MEKRRIALLSIFGLVALSAAGFYSRPVTGNSETKSLRFPSGLVPDPYELYESLPNYRALDEDKISKETDLSDSFPPPGDQGNQKSSVGFAVGFGLISYFEAEKNKRENISSINPISKEGQSVFYSPAYIYNQLNGGKDSGASLLEGLILAQSRGSVPLKEMNYTPSQFRSKPGANLIELGRETRFARIFKIDSNELFHLKHSISRRNPVVISFLTYENFLEAHGPAVYQSASGELLGAQSLVLIGYDDDKKAFRVWNSWGREWGDSGYLWISYSLIQKLTRAAYTVVPATDSKLYSEKQVLAILDEIPSTGRDLRPPNEIYATRGEFKDKIRVTWSKDPKAIGYEIYRKRKGEAKFQNVGLSRQTQFDDFGTQTNLAYTYRVASLDEHRISLPSHDSNEGYTSNDPKTNEIVPITNLTASIGKYYDRITLEWDSHLTADQYSIYKWNPSTKIFRFLGKSDKPGYVDYKASKNGDAELYRVFPHRKNLTGEGSKYVSGFLDPGKNIKLIPSQVTASKGLYSNKVIIEWDGSTNAIEYVVFRRKNVDDEWAKIGKTSKTNFTDENPPLTENDYAVSAVYDNHHLSAPSDYDTGYATSLSKRAEVSQTPQIINISESTSKSSVSIFWKKRPNIEKYSVLVRKKEERDWNLISNPEGSADETTISNLEKNEFYFVSIRAKESNKEESLASTPVVIVLSEIVKDIKKVRTFGESSITKFVGPWTAMYWDGKSNVKPVKLEIQSDDSQEEYTLKWNDKEFYRGKFAVDSHILEEKGKWKINLSPSADSLSAEFKEKNLLPEKGHLSFVRE